jgi:hypothetical protein
VRFIRQTTRILQLVALWCTHELKFLSTDEPDVTAGWYLSEVLYVNLGDSAYIRPSSAGSFPFTSPSIFCRSGGTSVMLKRTALRSNILDNHERSD